MRGGWGIQLTWKQGLTELLHTHKHACTHARTQASTRTHTHTYAHTLPLKLLECNRWPVSQDYICQSKGSDWFWFLPHTQERQDQNLYYPKTHLRDLSVHPSGYYANPSSCVSFDIHVCWLHVSARWPSVCYTRGRQRPSIDGQASWTAWKIIEAHILWCWDEKWLQLFQAFQGKMWTPSVRAAGSCGLKINNMQAAKRSINFCH